RYGLSKRLARMSWEGPVFVATDAEEGRVLHATVASDGPWQAVGGGMHPHLAAFLHCYAQPLLGRRSTGTLTRFHFAWDVTAASARLADSRIVVEHLLGQGAALSSH